MPSKMLRIVGLTASILVMTGAIAALSIPHADAAGKAERRVLATPINNPALAKKAGFPANALNVNMTTDGHMSWMMTKAEIQRQSDFNRDYLDPARKQVAASLTDGLATTTARRCSASATPPP